MIAEKIKDWAKTLGAPVRDIPPNDIFEGEIALGWSLISEEAKEFLEHVINPVMPVNPNNEVVFREEISAAQAADDLGDLLWVTIRLMQQLGLNPDEVISEIYKSNMSKICLTEEDAQKTCQLYAEGKHPNKMGEEIECYWKKIDNIYGVFRTSDNKVMKSYKFKEPDFSSYAKNIRIEKSRNSTRTESQ